MSEDVVVSAAGLNKRYPTGVAAVVDLDLQIHAGEFVSLLGPSGCGKTTTLRCIAGLEDVTSGTVKIGDRVVNADGVALPPHQRGIGMVFQSYALWPHMDVADNVGYPLKMQHVDRASIRSQVEQSLSMVGMEHKADAYPWQLSGGQQQRVALARALVGNPRVILFDEPLSNLDAQLREQMRDVVRVLSRDLGFSALYVTHDRLEAMVMSDRIVVMEQGRAVQTGTPDELYRHPMTLYVARILGDVNRVPGRVIAAEGQTATIEIGPDVNLHGRPHADAPVRVGDTADAMIRVGDVHVNAHRSDAAGCSNRLRATVDEVVFMGETWRLTLTTAGGVRVKVISLSAEAAVGDAVELTIESDDILILPSSTSPDEAAP